MRQVIIELSTRHGLGEDARDELLEAWSERAAMREYLAGFDRRGAEVWAIGDVEAMFALGLHCPETRRQMLAGGQRTRPTPRLNLRPIPTKEPDHESPESPSHVARPRRMRGRGRTAEQRQDQPERRRP